MLHCIMNVFVVSFQAITFSTPSQAGKHQTMSTDRKQDKNFLLISGYCRTESDDMNIIDGIISIIFEYQQSAKWSNIDKGEYIRLTDDDSKAICDDGDEDSFFAVGYGHSVRADFCIKRGETISWELECKIIHSYGNFFGVLSPSEVALTFHDCPATGLEHAYGIDDEKNCIYNGGGATRSEWTKPRFPQNKIFTIRVIANWTEKECKLTFYYNEQKLNSKQDDYTMRLPPLNENVVLYPCVTPFNKGAYCTIRYV